MVEAQGLEGDVVKKRKLDDRHPFEVVFGLPWTWDTFVRKAVQSQHPFLSGNGVPMELQLAIDTHIEWSHEQLCKYRLDWCKKVVGQGEAAGSFGKGEQLFQTCACCRSDERKTDLADQRNFGGFEL